MGFFDQSYFFENPEVLAVTLGILAFILAYYLLLKTNLARGPAMIVGIVIGAMTGYGLYRERFFGAENIIGIIFYIVVGFLILAIAWAFVKGFSGRRR